MVDENKPEEKKEGKNLELNIKDDVSASAKISTDKNKYTKEQIEKIEKTFIVYLLDSQKLEKQAQEIDKKLGFSHLVVARQTLINTIEVYLNQYKESQKKTNVEK